MATCTQQVPSDDYLSFLIVVHVTFSVRASFDISSKRLRLPSHLQISRTAPSVSFTVSARLWCSKARNCQGFDWSHLERVQRHRRPLAYRRDRSELAPASVIGYLGLTQQIINGTRSENASHCEGKPSLDDFKDIGRSDSLQSECQFFGDVHIKPSQSRLTLEINPTMSSEPIEAKFTSPPALSCRRTTFGSFITKDFRRGTLRLIWLSLIVLTSS